MRSVFLNRPHRILIGLEIREFQGIRPEDQSETLLYVILTKTGLGTRWNNERPYRSHDVISPCNVNFDWLRDQGIPGICPEDQSETLFWVT